MLLFNALAGDDPLRIPEYILPLQKLARIVLPDAENRTIVSSIIWTQYRNVTVGQTDRQNPSGYTALCIASNADAL